MRLTARIVEGRIEVVDAETGEPLEGVYRATVGWTEGEPLEVSAAWACSPPEAPAKPLDRAAFLGRADDNEETPKPQAARCL